MVNAMLASDWSIQCWPLIGPHRRLVTLDLGLGCGGGRDTVDTYTVNLRRGANTVTR